MSCNDSSRIRKNILQVLLFMDKQIPRATSHEYLDSTNSIHAFDTLHIGNIVICCSNEEPMMIDSFLTRQGNLCLQCSPIGRVGDGVRHVKECGNSTGYSRATSTLQIFLFWIAWISKVHVRVNGTGQQMQTGAIDDNLPILGNQSTLWCHSFDSTIGNTQVPLYESIGEDHYRILNKQVACHQ